MATTRNAANRAGVAAASALATPQTPPKATSFAEALSLLDSPAPAAGGADGDDEYECDAEGEEEEDAFEEGMEEEDEGAAVHGFHVGYLRRWGSSSSLPGINLGRWLP